MPARAKGRSIRGFFGVALYQPRREHNVGTLWRSAATYRAAFLATVGARYERQCSDTCHSPLHTPLLAYADLDDLIEHLPFACRLVAVEIAERAHSLTTYHHPERALYLLGAEDRGLPPAVLERCHEAVQIPAPMHYPLNVAVAGSIVIAHRHGAAVTGGA